MNNGYFLILPLFIEIIAQTMRKYFFSALTPIFTKIAAFLF